MASTAHGEPGSDELVALLSWGIAAVAAGLVVVLGIAVSAELLRRRRRASRLVAAIDRTIPIALRTAVVSLITLVTALVGARPAGGTDSVRGWLDGATTTTTVAAAPPTTVPPTTTTTTRVQPPTLAPPVVLDAPVTPEGLEPPTPAPTPAPKPAPTAPAPTPPPTAIGASERYVVVPGDCLWSIAHHQLGPGADARSIDSGWRAIYAANRVAIGDDPNLIHPGLTLTLPPLHLQP